jgi:hypothetical protein
MFASLISAGSATISNLKTIQSFFPNTKTSIQYGDFTLVGVLSEAWASERDTESQQVLGCRWRFPLTLQCLRVRIVQLNRLAVRNVFSWFPRKMSQWTQLTLFFRFPGICRWEKKQIISFIHLNHLYSEASKQNGYKFAISGEISLKIWSQKKKKNKEK